MTNETNLGPTSEIEIAITPANSISQNGGNVNSKVSTYFEQSAKLADMGENGVQIMREVYDGSSDPMKFFEAYNRVYAAGKKGGQARGRDISFLGEYASKMAYNAGRMDAMKKSSSKVLQNDGGSDTIETADDAIWRYKSSESYKINEAIRSGRRLTAEESAFIEELDRDLEKTPKYSGVTYRNISFDMQGQEAFDAFVAEHVVGKPITYNAYTSTSKSQNGYLVGGELTAHIEIYGENGHDISQGYGLEKEQEVLYGRKTRFVVTSVSCDGKTANIVMEEFANGERAIQGGIEGNKPTQQGHNTGNIKSSMQQMQESLLEESDDNLQDVSQRNTRRDPGQRSDLQEVRGEISSGANNSTQTKENAIEPKRVVYSSKTAKAYDAIPRDKLSKEQKRVVEVGAQIGRKVIFATTTNQQGVEVDGFIAKNGDIYINPNKNVAPMAFVFKHELAHFAQRAGQKYRDFSNAVMQSTAFKQWLKDKGFSSMQAYNGQMREERAAVGEKLDENGANREIIANFSGDMLFGDDTNLAENLVRELSPKQCKSVREYIREFFSWIKGKFVGDAGKATFEVRRLEKMFAAAYQEAVNNSQKISTQNEEFSYIGDTADNRRCYVSGFDSRLTMDEKIKLFKDRIATIFNLGAVELKTGVKKIQIRGDRFTSQKNLFGDKTGEPGEYEAKINSLYDLADILATSTYDSNATSMESSYANPNIKPKNAAHKGVKYWYKFKNNIVFDGVPYKVTFNIRDKGKEQYQYLIDFKEDKTPGLSNTAVKSLLRADQASYDNSIPQKSNLSTQNSKKVLNDGGESFSYTPQNDKVKDVFERMRNGELSFDDGEKLLVKPEGDNPATIASLKKEQMGSTPYVNKKTKGNVGDGDSKFAESVKKSSIFNEDFKKEVGEDNFIKHYASITNKETLAEAAKRLDEGGEAYVAEWLSKKAVHMDTVDTVVGFILLKRYQDVGKYEGATAVAQKVRDVGTLSGQRVQAFSIIGRFDADMMQAYAQKELDKAWELAIEGRSDKWLEKHKEQFKLTDQEISFIRDNILYAAQMPENSRERAIALAQITTLIQSKIPPVRGQSFKAWQRVSMLLNPRTQLRNVAGNAMMAPVFVASDFFSSGIDKLVSLKTNNRTTGITARGAKAAGKGFVKGLYESLDDFKRNIDTKQHELDRYSIGNGIGGKSFDEHTRFKALNAIAKKLNALDDITSHLLDIGDRPFFEMWYMWSLNNQMATNNVDIPTLEMMDIATEEALERTWQNDTTFSKVASKAKRVLNLPTQKKVGYGLGDVLIKFTKTPANIARAIYEYSPVSFVPAISSARKLHRAFVRGENTSMLQKQFVSKAGKALTGSVLYAIIGALISAGGITGAGDDDDDIAAYERYIQGIPDFSIKSGDKWITYDWAQPLGAYVAIVAEFLDSYKNGDSADTIIKNAISAGGGVLMDQSFMSSIQEFFAGSPDGEFDIFNSIFSSILNDISAMVPTLFSQIASFTDDKKRVTYDNTSEVNTAINRILVKIPGLRQTLEADVEVFGREIPNSQNNFYDAFLNAGNTYSDTSNNVTNHAYEIYKSTGDVGAIPAKAPYSVKYQNQSKKLTDEERAEYQRVMGGIAYDMIDTLLENEVYLEMSNNEKLSVLKEVYSYSAAVAKNTIAWYDSYEVIHGIADYITQSDFQDMSEEDRIQLVENDIFQDYKHINDIESDEGMSNYLINKKTPNLVLSATLAGDIDEAVKLIKGIEERAQSYGWDKTETNSEVADRRTKVKRTLTTYWKEAYLNAYYKKDTEEQNRILEMLTKIGLYGDRSDVKEKFAEWVKAYEEENQ